MLNRREGCGAATRGEEPWSSGPLRGGSGKIDVSAMPSYAGLSPSLEVGLDDLDQPLGTD